MLVKPGAYYLQKLRNSLDWKLLVFLLLFINVKLAVKIPAIALIYLLQFDFKLRFSLKNSRLPLFYLIVIAIAVINWLLSFQYTNTAYNLAWLTGISFWLMCILAIHQIKLSVEKNTLDVINRTIIVFFVINAVCSFVNLAAIIFEIHSINPYTYQGQYQKYFIGTGDYIRGISFDTSNTNAILNAIGVLWFLNKKKPLLLLMCMATLLLTCSNFINIVLLLIILGIFIFKSTRDQKSLIAACLVMMAIFMAKVSPQNNDYVLQTVKYVFLRQPKPVAPPVAQPLTPTPTPTTPPVLSADEQKQKIAQSYLDSMSALKRKIGALPKPAGGMIINPNGRILTPQADINSAPYQSLTQTPADQIPLINFIEAHKAQLPIAGNDGYKPSAPGKILGFEQTIAFLRQHPAKLPLGTGIANFSSKLAFKATGLGVSGGYPAAYIYINPAFLANHLDLYLNFFSKRAGFHSLSNSPFSVYDQVLAEYGLIGLLALLVFYFGYFVSHYQLLTYGIPILILMAAVFFVDYWFEQLSVVPFFELMLLLNIKETSLRKVISHEY